MSWMMPSCRSRPMRSRSRSRVSSRTCAYRRAFSMAMPACAASSSTRCWSSAENSGAPTLSARYRSPTTSLRTRMGTPSRLVIGGWGGGGRTRAGGCEARGDLDNAPQHLIQGELGGDNPGSLVQDLQPREPGALACLGAGDGNGETSQLRKSRQHVAIKVGRARLGMVHAEHAHHCVLNLERDDRGGARPAS